MKTRSFESKIQLTNSGNLSLFFIGSGTSFSKKYLQTNLIVVKGEDHLLVDCGTICSFVMNRFYNTDIMDIKNILITHPHSDHCGGMEEIGFMGKYVKGEKTNIIINDEFKQKLWENTLSGGMQYSEFGKMSFDDYFNQINPVQSIKKPYEIWQANIGSLDIKLFRTKHVTTKKDSFKDSQFSQGIIIDNRILYPCDTQFNPEQLQFLCETFNIEAIFHDCDLGGHSAGVHATYDQLKTLPKEIKSKMYLCHYADLAPSINPKNDGFAGYAKASTYYDFE